MPLKVHSQTPLEHYSRFQLGLHVPLVVTFPYLLSSTRGDACNTRLEVACLLPWASESARSGCLMSSMHKQSLVLEAVLHK